MKNKISKYLWAGATIGATVAMSFGMTIAAFNVSKEFAVVDMGWCLDTDTIHECSKSHFYASLANGATFIGAALGSLLLRYTGKLGLRHSIMIVNWFYILGSIFSASSVHFGMIFTGRLISGLGVGLSATIPVFLLEICKPSQRKYFTLIYQLFITFGLLVSAAFQLIHGRIVVDTPEAPFELTLLDHFVWRGSQALPIITSVIALILIHFVITFNTPYELISRGKNSEAREVIEKFHGTEAVNEVFDVVDRDQEVSKSTPNISFFTALKNPKYRKPIIHCFVLACIQQLSGITILTSNVAMLFLQMMGRSFVSTLCCSIMFLVNFIATVIVAFIISKFGRKTFLIGGMSFSTIFLALAAFSKPIGKDAQWVPIVSAVGSIGFIIGFAIGLGGMVWVYLSEVFATEYRDGAYSVAVFLNWSCAAITLIASEFLIPISEVLVNTILFGISLFGVIYITLFIRETKGVPLGKAYD